MPTPIIGVTTITHRPVILGAPKTSLALGLTWSIGSHSPTRRGRQHNTALQLVSVQGTAVARTMDLRSRVHGHVL
jgi:hypothetical protein